MSKIDDIPVNTQQASPHPASLIESLRAVGYDLSTAIADLIDNSIAAKASNVWLEFTWAGTNSVVTVRDDGKGMNSTQLLEAMRLGSQNPTDERSPGDLGRFGLGLKTASFSQCRILAVRSKQSGAVAAELCWDLDFVRKTNQWLVLESAPDMLRAALAGLNDMECGTAIGWGNLDRIVGEAREDDEAARDHFYRLADEVSIHLGRTFNDYLRSGELRIHAGGSRIQPWDPFLERHSATQVLPVETLGAGPTETKVSAYVLPHHSKLSDQEYELAAGNRDWISSQGFYIYRNRRLLVAGDWLGLGFHKEKHHELARIRVDIGNTADSAWQLDVKKSRAQPPLTLRGPLKRVARLTRQKAANIYSHRGAKLIPRDLSEKKFLWIPTRRHGKNIYKLDRNHPVLEAVNASCENRDLFGSLLKMLEETVPTPTIAMNEAEQPKEHAMPFEGVPVAEIYNVIRSVFDTMVSSGQTPKDAFRVICHLEPFDQFPELLESLRPQ